MTTYSYAELERLWIDAGGPAADAPTAAAIAEAESGGNSDAHNPSGASGLWQILGNPFPGNAFDPATNARMAVAKWKAAHGFTPWVTFTSGAYKGFLSGKTTPAAKGSIAGSPTAQTTASITSTAPDPTCAWSIGLGIPLIGGNICLLSKDQLCRIIGAGLMLTGGMVALAGLAVLAVAGGMKAVPPLGKAAEGVGGALLLVPGAEGVGAGIMAAGKTAKNPAAAGRARQSRQASEETSFRRQVGEPRENPRLEARGGTVREDRRSRSARRSRERRTASDEAPPF